MIHKKIVNKKAAIAYLEMFIIISASFAFSYIIYENTFPLGEAIDELEKINQEMKIPKINLLKSLGLIILEKLKQPLLPMVSAQDEVCCERTNNGLWCEDSVQTNCDPGYSITPTSCNQSGWCEKGCCYNPSEGFCIENTYEGSCGGEWQEGDCQNLLSCKKACCTYGGQSTWTTERECEIIAGNHPDRAWDTTIQSEVQCILVAETQGVGACVRDTGDGKICRFVPEAECVGDDIEFSENYLCTHPDLDVNCSMTQETTCVDGKDEVYFKDSCDNIANIYDASRVNDAEYWKMKIPKKDSCNFGDLNGNMESKTCGNCKYVDGSTCSSAENIDPNHGDNMCKDLSCEVEIEGEDLIKQNGESWCSFDGAIGVGTVYGENIARDIVGSRYWRHVCLDGEERIEPCADYRNEVCSMGTDNETGKTYSVCRINRWRDCVNRKPGVCEENADCWVKHIAIDDFEFKVCLPKYPGGFDIFEGDANRNGQNICGLGTQTCHVVYTKAHKLASCKCDQNCECEDPIFAQKMNSLCVSLGDCGGYVNTEGQYTDQGYNIQNSDNVPLKDIIEYIAFADISLFPGQVIGVGAFMEAPSFFSLTGPDPGEPDDPGWNFNAGSAASTVIAIVAVVAWWGPIGWIIGAILIAIAYFLGIGEVCDEFDVVYTCKPWQPPIGGDDCERCNDNPEKPCTTYRCESLGKACEFINEGSDAEKCIASIDDGLAPKITPLFENVSEGLVYEDIQTNGFRIRNEKSDDGCMESFTPITFSIQTDEPSICKYDLVRESTFGDMPEYLGGSNLLIENHTHGMLLPSPESILGFYQVPTEYILEAYGDMKLFVECQDSYGNTNSVDYQIEFCIKEGPDTTPPSIDLDVAEPLSESYLGFGQTSQDVKIWVNEPSECRWSEEDKNFDLMENNMDCLIYLENYNVRGWPCEFSLTGITEDKSTFIRCKDKPWLDPENETRNINQESIEYVTKISNSELKIEEMKPEDGEVITSGADRVMKRLRLRTSGGAEEGQAICSWREDSRGWHDEFIETDSIFHTTSEFDLTTGDYNFDYSCTDIAGNTARTSSSFEVEIDRTAPRIIRIYFDGGLKVITNSDAECRYAFERSTNWGNATKMHGNGLEHVGEWQLRTYYIQCEDEYKNKGGKKKIKAYTIL